MFSEHEDLDPDPQIFQTLYPDPDPHEIDADPDSGTLAFAIHKC
jgi:hypothetical protein